MYLIYYILIGFIVLVIAIDLYNKKKQQKTESKDVEKFNDNIFTKEPRKFNPLLLIGVGLIVLTTALFVTDKFVYDGRLSNNNDGISLIQNLTFDKMPINEILNKDSLWINKTNLSPINAIIFDSLDNFNGIIVNGLQQGIWRYYFENNQIKAELNFINGRGITIGATGIPKDGRDGVAKFWYKNGNLSTELLYRNGIYEGPYKSFHENGNPEEESNFKDGLLNGPFKLYHENGQLERSLNYKLSDRTIYSNSDKEWKRRAVYDGLVSAFYENGNKSFEAVYDQGAMTGSMSEWYINGNIKKTGNYADSPHDKKYISCTNCGSNGIRSGLFKDFDQDGVITSAEVFYFDWELRYNNISETYFYTNGKLNQITKYRSGVYYYDDNSIKSITWYKNGEIQQFQEYKNGNPYGKRRHY